MSTDEFEVTARRLTHARLAYYGYTSDAIAEIESTTSRVHQEHGCEFDTNSLRWICTDVDDKPLHPDHDEMDQTAEFVVWLLEELAAAAHGDRP